MGRIRTIKPDFWTSDDILSISIPARLFFIGLWNFADDEGRMQYSARKLKAQIFPADDMSISEIESMIVELEKRGMIRTYNVQDIDYLCVTGWHHQVINRPQRSKLPQFTEHSVNNHGLINDYSLGKGKERKGKERKGKEYSAVNEDSVNENEASNDLKKKSKRTPGRENLERIAEIVAVMNDEFGTAYRPDTSATVSLITALIKQGYTDSDFADVCRHKAAEWKGTQMQEYLRPQTIFGSKFETYLNAARMPKPSQDNKEKNGSYQQIKLREFANAVDAAIAGAITEG